MIRSPAGFDGSDRIKRYLDYYQPSYGVMMLSAGQAFSPASLFAAGEQGVWYDPSDFSTMFQDSAGTTPVTAVEQPVGLLLDKSRGLVLGSELVTNGDFASPTGWVTGAGATISGGKLNLSAASGYVLYRNPVAGVQVGGYYEVTFTVSGYVSGSIRPYLGATATFGTTVSANGTYTQRFGPTSGGEVGFNSASAFTGAIDDLSVKAISGNHATQSTTASRPVLSARVNQLTYSEQFDNAAWAKTALNTTGTPPWINAGVAPNGTTTAEKLIPNTASDFHYLNQTVTVSSGAAHTASFYAKADGYGYIRLYDAASGGNAVFNLSGAGSYSNLSGATATIVAVGDAGWYRCTLIFTASASCVFSLYPQSTASMVPFAGNGTSGILVWGADLRPTNQTTLLPAYQRIAAATDYDTTGFPYYLRFDGTDDSMVTTTITPGIDKAQVFSGVRKQSDAAFGMIVEGNTTGDGKLYLGNQTSGIYQFYSRGTADAYAAGVTAFPAPSSNVISGLGDISGPFATVRVNGVTRESVSSSQGTGNYAAQPLYIGSRAGSSLRFNGNLYSLIVRFGSNLDATTISNTETWVNGKTLAY